MDAPAAGPGAGPAQKGALNAQHDQEAQPEEQGALLAACIDNRAGEVGLAVLDAAAGALVIMQHVEATRSFAVTL